MAKKRVKLSVNNWESAILAAFIYLILGLLWIFVSDKIVEYSLPEHENIQTVKGFMFVLISSAVIFILVQNLQNRKKDSLELFAKRNILLNSIFSQYSDFNAILVNKSGIITQVYGSNSFGVNQANVIIKGNSIYDWHEESLEKEKLSLFMKKIWEGEIQETTLVKGEAVFFLKGVLITDSYTGTQIAVITSRDITNLSNANKKSESLTAKVQELNENIGFYKNRAEEFTSLLDQLKEGIVISQANLFGSAGKTKYINPEAKKILGLHNSSELQDFQTSEASDFVQQLLNHNFLIEAQIKNHFSVKTSAGDKNIRATSNYLVDTSIIATELKEQRETYRTKKEIVNDFFKILNGISDGVIIISPDGKCIYTNNAMIDLYGLKIENDQEISLIELMAMTGHIDSSQLVARVLNGEVVETDQFQIAHNGNAWYRTIYHPVFNHHKEVIWVFKLTKKVDNNLAQPISQDGNITLDKVIEINILPSFSHEIRTAMNSILGSADLLESYPINNEQKSFVELIKRGVEDVTDLLESFKLISLLKSKSLLPEMDWFTIAEIIDDLQSQIPNIKRRYSKQHLKVEFNVLPEIANYKIRNDQIKIKQVLVRLIENSIKYTLEGSITVGFNTLNNRQLSIWVEDTGVGISPANLPSIFIPFSSVNQPESGMFGGIGIGLSIAKDLTELIGGTIEVESEVNKGTKFKLMIPIANKESTTTTGKSSKIPMIKVLIAQYGYVFNPEIKSYLKKNNIKVLNAINGGDAIELLAEHKDINIIFSDIRHSDMSGLEFVKAAKRILPDVMIIAQAPYFIPKEKIKLLNNGFDDYLVKPIYNPQFIKTIEKFAPNRSVH